MGTLCRPRVYFYIRKQTVENTPHKFIKCTPLRVMHAQKARKDKPIYGFSLTSPCTHVQVEETTMGIVHLRA